MKFVLPAVIILILGGLFWYGMSTQNNETAQMPITPTPQENIQESLSPVPESGKKNPNAILKTNKGDIRLELFLDKTPITTGNFIKLAKSGYYDGTKFHRVIAGFMIQGGDPNSKGNDSSKYGVGGPGYTISDEFVAGLSNVRGTISMANTGAPNSGGSQFFINQASNIGLDFDKPPLTSSHPVFGKVVVGMDVMDTIAKVKTDSDDIPLEPVIISKVIIEE